MVDLSALSEQDLELRAKLLGSYLFFTRTFFKLVTKRDFVISNPPSREPHAITVSRALTKCFRLETNRLVINIPPGHGKSVMVCSYVAWAMAHYPDSNFLYISYSVSLAAKHTEFIRRIMMLPEYEHLFGVKIRSDARGKEKFLTTAGGSVCAFGSAGAITGEDAGLPSCNRSSGAIIMDDLHKPDEASSDTMRESVISNYKETIAQRARGPNVPFIFIGQRLHERDIAAYFLDSKDGYDWERVILKGIDDAGNPLYPENFPIEQLRIKEKFDRYVFSAQIQQDPVPAGGALYREEDFVLLDAEPEILLSFVTCDTAETTKTYNDATAISFWGLYYIVEAGVKTNKIGLHWIDCLEIRIEPSELENKFRDFWSFCCSHSCPPQFAAIEQKSTGVTLISAAKKIRAIEIREITRAGTGQSKSQRFIDIQSPISQKYVSITAGARHERMCIMHMIRITANDSHAHDDIADTCADALRMVYIDRTVKIESVATAVKSKVLAGMAKSQTQQQSARQTLWQ